jgi:CheY-like chemotaxis protein
MPANGLTAIAVWITAAMKADMSPLAVASLLVVDDSAVQRAHAVALCRQLGVHMIYEACSGLEALELLGMLRLPPDLLIVDLEMPGMDGIELIQHLHARGFTTPLLVVSSREISLIQSVETLARNLGFGVFAMQKPLKLGPLSTALQRLNELSCATVHEAASLDAGLTFTSQMLTAAIGAGDIKVHYQPKVDMRTGIVRGVEALARWQPTGAAFVRPDQFIALAEREDLIHELTLSVMNQAMVQASDWNSHGLKLSIAINLSPSLLDRPSLVQEVLEMAERHRLQANQVVLEITETSLVDCMGAALGVLARLRLKGFGLSIDD